MKNIFLLFFLSLSILYQKSFAEDMPDEKMLYTWNNFIEVVSNADCNSFISLSVSKIKCYMCLENTDEESKDLAKFRDTKSDWYEKLYNEKIYIAVKYFCEKDMPLIFNQKLISRIKSGKTLYHKIKNNKISGFEVVVTTIKKDELFSGHEGFQYVFEFKQTQNGYKFSGISTIP